MTFISPISFSSPVRQGSQPRLGVTSQPAQGAPRFSGAAFRISQELKAAAQQEEGAKLQAVCDTLVWKQGNNKLTVSDMVTNLCKIRKDEGYPGYGTLATLMEDFPGMNTHALESGFNKIQEAGYLGQDSLTKKYFLTPMGAKMMWKSLPHENRRFEASWMFGPFRLY